MQVCTPLFSIIFLLYPVGANKDYLVISSDSGKISISEFDEAINDWKLVHCEVFGKTGCRRIVPGQYLAADPKGRAIMIAAIEKQKFVYIMNRDSANRLTISSPLEAHKSETVIFSLCGVDVGFNNPVFAMIELEYKEADEDPTGQAAAETEKRLTYYELDLGLNHVVRKWTEPISRTANLLVTVPGGDDGPSGVLICGDSWISYKNMGHPEVRTALPRRRDLPPERGLLVTAATLHRQKGGIMFFIIQSEYGDLYKVTLELSPTDKNVVVDVVVTVFDTLSSPANSLCITKTGFLFVASEMSNHQLFQFQGMGDDEDAVRAHCVPGELNEMLGDDSVSAAKVAKTFEPTGHLRNLAVTDDIDSLAPITDMLIDDLSREGTKQIYALCGRGNRSTLRVMRHGVSVTELAVSELPGRPIAVWTVRDSQDSEYDKYIVVSFNNATLVLSIGDNVEEVTDSGFLGTSPTLDVVLLADNALLQVHTEGIRHLRRDEHTGEQRVMEWKTPGKKVIEKATANSRQVAISLAGGEIIYFEVDAAGQLVEIKTFDMEQEVSCLDIGEVPPGYARSSFLAVGCWDETVQILSLEPSDLLATRSSMKLPARPESVCLVRMDGDAAAGGKEATAMIYLNIGLTTGVLHRVAVDMTAGTLSDSRQRFLGPKPVKLFRIMVQGRRGVLALSTRAWLLYNYQGRYMQAPLSYETLEYASNFASEPCPEGIVAIAGNTLRIISVNNLGTMFNQTSHSLRYTPRKMIRHNNTIIIIETDQNEFNAAERAAIEKQKTAKPLDDDDMDISDTAAPPPLPPMPAAPGENGDEESDTTLPIRGPIPPAEGKWASCIRILEPNSGSVLELLELADNEAAFSLCTCSFSSRPEETFLIVGTAKDLKLHPRNVTCGYLHVYRVLADSRLQLLHKTPLEEIPLAICAFNGRLLVGMGRSLRLYELGKRQLLKKCENKQFPSLIGRLHAEGYRIYAADMAESIHFVRYKERENTLTIFADDYSPRYVND